MLACSRLLAAFVAVSWIVAGGAAHAACTKLASSVNDYGKTGPTADAKALLDKHIARWAKEHGVSKYTAGQKTVTCELYLDVGVFDEYTCKAVATVCWEAPHAAPASAPATNKKK
jgi:hypothetical protein